jgi:hypothetical protein
MGIVDNSIDNGRIEAPRVTAGAGPVRSLTAVACHLRSARFLESFSCSEGFLGVTIVLFNSEEGKNGGRTTPEGLSISTRCP